MTYSPSPHRPSLVWPILFIGAGVYFLLVNLGHIAPISWEIVSRFWPVLLILVGLDILFGRRSLIGGLASSLLALLLVGGLLWLLIQSPEEIKKIEWLNALNPAMKTQKLDVPLEQVKTADIDLSMGTGTQIVNALPETSLSLMEGKINYYGRLNYSVEGTGDHRSIYLNSLNSDNWLAFKIQATDWRISLHPDILYRIRLDTGSGRNKIDLSGLKIEQLELDTGSGRIDISLPAGDYDAEMDIGSGQVEIYLPADAAAQVRLDQGSGRFRASGFNLVEGGDHDNAIWETESYSTSSQHINIDIDQGSGNILLKSE